MFLVVGLGNPGKEYQSHRHNIGFMAADAIASAFSFSAPKSAFRAKTSQGEIAGQKVLILRPTTYMNNSGESVQEAAAFHKIAPENIIVLHDELDLAFLKLRAKRGGGNGGHNGLKSIDAHCGKEYVRIRLGIGHPRDTRPENPDVSDYVLSNFSKAEMKEVTPWLEDLARHFPLLIQDDMAGFMNKMAPLSTSEEK